MRYFLLLVAFFVCAEAANAQGSITVASPSGNLMFTLRLTEKRPTYSVTYKKVLMIDRSRLGLVFAEGDFSENIIAGKPAFRHGEEIYDLVIGKTKHVQGRYHEIIIPLEQTISHIHINLVVRVFDDGIGFRYQFVDVAGHPTFELMDEKTSFRLAGDPTALTLMLPNFTTSHEGFYTKCKLSEIKDDTLMDVPALFEFPGKRYLAITEAALTDYAGMYLIKKNGELRNVLSPRPDKPSVRVIGRVPHKSPWRVLMISDRLGALIESNLITNLNEPQKLKDVSWLRPGKTTFPWWNGNIVPDTLNAPGNNFVTQQYYIDFCARNGLEYHSVVEYGLHQWYQDDGISFQPGPHPDVTKPVPGLDMKQVCDYAHSKGVDVRVWVHWGALYPKLDSAFAIFEKWGLSGMMIDFMDRDDQLMVNIQNEMLEKAARHHLHVQFHGAYKPTGLHRTYPNEFTREGTLNYETNKWDRLGLSPDHDINMPFTRMLAGSTDYHLGGFRAVANSEFKTQYTRPLMLGTRCHMLAMYVVLESYLGMVCDYPDAYEGQPGFDFIRQVPTVWDETKVIDAKLSEYIVVARRKGRDWFVGAINNSQAREISIPLSFLGNGKYRAQFLVDQGSNPNGVSQKDLEVTPTENFSVRLTAGGGMVARIIGQ